MLINYYVGSLLGAHGGFRGYAGVKRLRLAEKLIRNRKIMIAPKNPETAPFGRKQNTAQFFVSRAMKNNHSKEHFSSLENHGAKVRSQHVSPVAKTSSLHVKCSKEVNYHGYRFYPQNVERGETRSARMGT